MTAKKNMTAKKKKKSLLNYAQFLRAIQDKDGPEVLCLTPSLECRSLAWLLHKEGLIDSVQTETDSKEPGFDPSFMEEMSRDPATLNASMMTEAPPGYWLRVSRPVENIKVQRHATTTLIIRECRKDNQDEKNF